MFKEIPDLLSAQQVAQLRQIAAAAQFVDGRISNPHSKVKQNLQLNEANAYQQSSQVIVQAMRAHEDFNNFVLPGIIAPPLMTRYTKGMHYGSHFDVAHVHVGNGRIRSDVSCTVFLSDPATYKGGALCIHLGTQDLRFRGPPGSCVVYPSDTLHEVEPVQDGERLVAITFIQSRVRDPFQRDILYELGEVSALEGNGMRYENLTRLQRVQQNLLRTWAEPGA
jgi:PKHD-type hydroxylase